MDLRLYGELQRMRHPPKQFETQVSSYSLLESIANLLPKGFSLGEVAFTELLLCCPISHTQWGNSVVFISATGKCVEVLTRVNRLVH